MKAAGNAWSMTKETFSEWSQDNVSRLAAALAYYTIFSLAPLLVIVITVVGMVTKRLYDDPDKAKTAVFGHVESLMGSQAADAISNMVKNAAQTGSGWMMVLGIGLLLYGATNVFASLQDSLNTIWEVKPRPGLGIVQTLRTRLLSFAMVLGIAFLLMVSLVISAVLAWATKKMGGEVPSILWRVGEQAASLGIFTLIFAAIYKVLPDVKIGWRSVWVGAAMTAVLFTIGKYLIGMYLGRSSAVNVYGAAGSLVIILLWIYYASQILFFGAEFTQVYSRRRLHARIKPTENAVKLTERERIKQGMPHQKTIEKAVAAADGQRDVVRKTGGQGGMVAYMAAAAGLVAGFVVGGSSKVIRNRDRAVREAVAQRMHERVRLLYARLKEGEDLSTCLREADVQDRLDLIERRVKRIADLGLRNAD